MNSCPLSFMVTGPPSRRRLSTEKAVSSNCDMLGREPAFRRAGLRGVLKDDLLNIGILKLSSAIDYEARNAGKVKGGLLVLFTVVMDTALFRRKFRNIAGENGGEEAYCFLSFAALGSGPAVLPADFRRAVGLCDRETGGPHVLVAVRQHGCGQRDPPAYNVASGQHSPTRSPRWTPRGLS